MKIQPGNFCPLLKKECVQTQCKWFRPVDCVKPGTAEHFQEWDCAMSWLVVLQKDAISAALTTTASTDKMCNEVVKRMDDPVRVVELPNSQPLAIGQN